MYYEDLTVYTKWGYLIGRRILNVGWLSREYLFTRKSASSDFLDNLFQYCLSSVKITRGYHRCPFCIKPISGLRVERNGQKTILGSAEIRIKGLGGKIYAAPNLIYHYVEAHDYSPPEEFIQAVLAKPRPWFGFLGS